MREHRDTFTLTYTPPPAARGCWNVRKQYIVAKPFQTCFCPQTKNENELRLSILVPYGIVFSLFLLSDSKKLWYWTNNRTEPCQQNAWSDVATQHRAFVWPSVLFELSKQKYLLTLHYAITISAWSHCLYLDISTKRLQAQKGISLQFYWCWKIQFGRISIFET